MKLTTALTLLAVLGVTPALPIENVDLSAEQQAELSSLVANLQQFNKDHDLETRDLVARSDLPIVDQVLSLLNNSGLAPIVIKNVLLNPALLDLSSNATIFLLRLNLINYEDLVIAFQKSGLVNQLLLAGLEDQNVLPGLLRLTSELLKKNVVGIYFDVNPPPPGTFLGNFTVLGDISTALTTRDQFSNLDLEQITKRESQLLNELFVSLKESGLVVSVVQTLLTDPALAEPSAQFLINILQADVIPICDIAHILEENNILMKILGDILTDPEILRAFGELIIDRVGKGLIPEGLVSNITTK